MARLNLEKLAAEKRMRQRGTESVHESGLGLVRRAEDRRHMDRLAERIDAWKREPSIEDVVERNAATRAPQEAYMRAVLDACED